MLDTLLLQELDDECRAYRRQHERLATLEASEREEFYQREMFGTVQRLAVLALEATRDPDEELLEEEA